MVRITLFQLSIHRSRKNKTRLNKRKVILTYRSLWELWFLSAPWYYSLLWKVPSSCILSPVSHIASFGSGSDINLTRVLQMRHSLKIMTAKAGCCWLHFQKLEQKSDRKSRCHIKLIPTSPNRFRESEDLYSFVQSVKKNMLRITLWSTLMIKWGMGLGPWTCLVDRNGRIFAYTRVRMLFWVPIEKWENAVHAQRTEQTPLLGI